MQLLFMTANLWISFSMLSHDHHNGSLQAAYGWNVATARMDQLVTGLPRANDSTTQIGHLINLRLASYNVTPTTPPPSHYINVDMEAQAQLISM